MLKVDPAPSAKALLRIAIGRKIIPVAPKRNRWKRRIREAVRPYKASLKCGIRLTLRLLETGKEPPFQEMQEEILGLLGQAGVFEAQ